MIEYMTSSLSAELISFSFGLRVGSSRRMPGFCLGKKRRSAATAMTLVATGLWIPGGAGFDERSYCK